MTDRSPKALFTPERLLLVAAALMVVYLVVTPLAYIVYSALTGQEPASLAFLWSVFRDDVVLEATRNSLLLAFGVAIFSVLFGVPLAFGTERTDMRWRGLIRVAVIIAIISPDFFLAMAYVLLMGPNSGYLNILLRFIPGVGTETPLGSLRGPLNIFTLWGFVFAALPTGVAFVYMQVAPAFRNMDPSLEEAARASGYSAWGTIRNITLPLMRPSIVSGALLAFAISLAMYGTPHILGLNVLTTQMQNSLLVSQNLHRTSGIAVIATIITMSAMFGYQYLVRHQDKYRTVVGKSFQPGIMRVGALRHFLSALGLLYALVAFILPYGVIVIVSFSQNLGKLPLGSNFTAKNYLQVFTDARILDALQTSTILAFTSATLVVALGVVVGNWLTRRRSTMAAGLDFLAMLPLGISGTALAAGLLVVYVHPPFDRLPVYGTVWILMISYTTRFLGFGVRSAKSGMTQLSAELAEGARTSGAGPLRTLWLITVPLVKGSLVFAWILVFIQAFPEISSSIMLKSLGVQTSATVILDLWDGSGGFPLASALSTVVFITVAVGMLIAQRLGGRPN